MDAFSNLPDALLSAIHHRVHDSGSLHDALALEATSKQLNAWFRSTTRFQQDVAVDGACLGRAISSASFWRWIAAHGRRVDSLKFHQLDCNDGLPVLSTQAGVVDALAVSAAFGRIATLEPLAGLANLRHLQCLRLTIPAGPDPADPANPADPAVPADPAGPADAAAAACLHALGTFTALESLSVGDRYSDEPVTPSLAGLAALARLTRLELMRVQSPAALDALSSLRPALQSLSLCDLPATTLQPLAGLTALTSLSLDALPGACSSLGPLAALSGLRRLRLAQMPQGAGPALDIRPLGRLSALQALALDSCMIASAAPIAALARHLEVLEASLVLMAPADSEKLEATVGGLGALTRLELCHRAPYGASGSGAFLRPLTSLQQLQVLDPMGSMELVGELAALQLLRVYGSREVASLAPLGRLGALRQLHLVSFERVSSLQPLGSLTGLQQLSIMYFPRVSDLAPLAALARLRRLRLAGCPLVDQSAIAMLRAALPALTVTT